LREKGAGVFFELEPRHTADGMAEADHHDPALARPLILDERFDLSL
jgi:hypothetical protein